jgi:hypothetical protein
MCNNHSLGCSLVSYALGLCNYRHLCIHLNPMGGSTFHTTLEGSSSYWQLLVTQLPSIRELRSTYMIHLLAHGGTWPRAWHNSHGQRQSPGSNTLSIALSSPHVVALKPTPGTHEAICFTIFDSGISGPEHSLQH